MALAPQDGKAGHRQAAFGGLNDQLVQNARAGEHALKVGPGIAGVELSGVGRVEQGGMHGIGTREGVADQRQGGAALDHVGGVAVARGKLDPATAAVTLIPAGLRRVEGCHGGKGEHLRPRRGDGIGAGCITRRPRAVEQHAVEIVKERLIYQTVEIGVDVGVAEKGLILGDQAKMGPALLGGDGVQKRHLTPACTGRRHGFKADHQRRAVIDEHRPMARSDGLKIALFRADLVNQGEPSVGIRRGGGIHRYVQFGIGHEVPPEKKPAHNGFATRKGDDCIIARWMA